MELDPERPRYAYVYGVALHGIGDMSAAIDVLEAARRRHPANAAILQALSEYRSQVAEQGVK